MIPFLPNIPSKKIKIDSSLAAFLCTCIQHTKFPSLLCWGLFLSSRSTSLVLCYDLYIVFFLRIIAFLECLTCHFVINNFFLLILILCFQFVVFYVLVIGNYTFSLNTVVSKSPYIYFIAHQIYTIDSSSIPLRHHHHPPPQFLSLSWLLQHDTTQHKKNQRKVLCIVIYWIKTSSNHKHFQWLHPDVVSCMVTPIREIWVMSW